MPRKFAAKTHVAENKSRAEIEQLVYQYAGRNASFSYGTTSEQAAIMFVAFNRRVKFLLRLPTPEEAVIQAKRKNGLQDPPESKQIAWMDQERRRRWRALLLSIKAKLEAVESGIYTFEQEFLGHIVPDSTGDQTIYERMMAGPDRKLLAPVLSTSRTETKKA